MTKKPGRNTPCPCGSGVKYKRCCGRASTALGSFTLADRGSALNKLARFLEGPGWPEVFEEAERSFWDSVDEGPIEPTGEAAQALALMSQGVFESYLFYDFEIKPGWHVVNAFLAAASNLSAAERRYLRSMETTALRLYEVTAVRPGESITLRDVFDGEVVRVRERKGSQQLPCWTWLAARVNPKGASGQPEIDGGMLPISPLRRDQLMDQILDELEWSAAYDPEADERQRWGVLAPVLHAAWRSPMPMPRLVNDDGDPVVLTTVRFVVEDPERLTLALDGARALEREGAEKDRGAITWVWSGTGRDREEPVTFGWFELCEGLLELTTNSVERGERGRKLITRVGKQFVRYQVTVTEDPSGTVQRALAEGQPAKPLPTEHDEVPPALRDQLQDAAEEHLAEHYERWLDEQIPMLGNRTPRQAAAGSVTERASVVALIKDLERMYEEALTSGDAAYDPTWIRDELEIGAEFDAARGPRPPPQPAHASLVEPMPAVLTAAHTIVERLRRERATDFDATISPTELDRDLVARSFVRDHIDASEQDERRAWLDLLCNFELHLRKLFLVDESLAWMLGATEIDLSGDDVRMPFASFAVVFTDRYALGLAERMLSREPRARLRGRILRSLTVYVTQVIHGDVRHLRVSLGCDADDGQLPSLVVRELVLRPEATFDEILDSSSSASSSPRSPEFAGSPIRRLMHLLFNAILYANSMRPSAEPSSKGRSGPSQTESLQSDSVHFLPGTIDIGSVAQLKRLHRSSRKRRSIMQRTMVRGHWRRAAAGWTEQRPRWIAPHWRGPADAAIIEKTYRLEP
jgi:hypothetical protein